MVLRLRVLLRLSVSDQPEVQLKIFMAVAIGIICGTGYIGIAVLFTLIVCVIGMFLSLVKFGQCEGKMRYLKITVPENLNYDEVFEEVLNEYFSSYELEKVKTLSLGS